MKRTAINKKLRRMVRRARARQPALGLSPMRAAYPFMKYYYRWDMHVRTTPIADIRRICSELRARGTEVVSLN